MHVGIKVYVRMGSALYKVWVMKWQKPFVTNLSVFVMLVLLGSATRRQQNYHDKHLLRVCSVEILLMMDSGPVRNM